MSRNKAKEQKLIRVPTTIVSEITKIAREEGKTIYRYISDILEQAIRAYGMKYEIRNVLDEYEIFEIHEKAGSTMVFQEIVDFSLEKLFSEEQDLLLNLSYKKGRWYGTYLKLKFEDALVSFIRLLKVGRFNLSEVIAKITQEYIEIKCVLDSISHARTLMLKSFIEGVMNSLGYDVKDEDCFQGIIRLRFFPISVRDDLPL